MSKVVAYDGYSGTALGEILCSPNRAWLLNEYSQANFTLDIAYARSIRTLLKPGNLIMITHPDLPAWAGVIDLPVEWADGTVTLHAYSAEYMLTENWRIGDGVKRTGQAGKIFTDIINLANKPEDLLFRMGDVFMGGSTRTETVDCVGLYSEINRIAARTGFEWCITPVLDDYNRLSFRASWYEFIGIRREDYLLDDRNTKVASTPLTEKGPILNNVIGIGTQTTTGSTPKYQYNDTASQAAFRMRCASVSFDGDKTAGTLETNTKNYVAKNSRPRNVLSLSALNIDNLYKKLAVGDTVRVIKNNVGMVGIDTYSRITGLQYDEPKEEVSLTTEEVIL